MQITTPFGSAWIFVNSEGAVTGFGFGVREDAQHDEHPRIKDQIDEYFAGARVSFDFPLAAEGTPFQKQVWAELVKVPFGETISYSELARRVGCPGAARAVGRANATNPIALIVPCHRVIGANGKLTGYAGGLELKEKLLDFERSVI